MIDRIQFILSEAFVSLGRNRWMSFAAISTAAMALLLLGGLGFAYVKINQFANTLPSKFEISVFLKDNLAREKGKAFESKIEAIPGVGSAIFIPKEREWERMSKEQPEITQGLENPLPDMYRVRVKELTDAPGVAKALWQFPEVGTEKNVKYLAKEQEFLLQILRTIRLAGLILGGMMLLTSGILIYNAIRMTVVARRREHRIMHLVGATRTTVVLPLLIEGFIQGMTGGIIATVCFWLTFEGTQALMSSVLKVQMGEEFPWRLTAILFLFAGGTYGLICSAIAVRGKELVVATQ